MSFSYVLIKQLFVGSDTDPHFIGMLYTEGAIGFAPYPGLVFSDHSNDKFVSEVIKSVSYSTDSQTFQLYAEDSTLKTENESSVIYEVDYLLSLGWTLHQGLEVLKERLREID